MANCSECGVGLLPDWEYCGSCGAKLAVSEVPEEHSSVLASELPTNDSTEVSRQRVVPPRVAPAIIGVLALLGLGLASWWFGPWRSDPELPEAAVQVPAEPNSHEGGSTNKDGDADSGGDEDRLVGDREVTDDTSAPQFGPTEEPAGLERFLGSTTLRPAGVQDCSGLFGLCLSAPIERVQDLLGLEDDRFGDAEDVYRQWWMSGLNLTIRTDSIGSVREYYVKLTGENSHVLLALPDGLLLGESTLGDVRRQFGEPHEVLYDEFWAVELGTEENERRHGYFYEVGPEGTEKLTFYHQAPESTAPNSGTDLDSGLVTSFEVRY